MSKRLQSLDDLFVSKVRIKTLKFFLMNPTHPIHLRGAVRELKEEINAVRRELLRLESIKFVSSEVKGNRKYFILNLDHPFVDELLGMFHKSFGLGGDICDNLKKLGDIDFAFLTSSYTKDIHFGKQIIDLMIIGIVDMNLLESIIKKAENREGREIHYTVLKPSELQIRKRRKDPFLYDLFIQDIVLLKGRREDLIK